MDVRQLLGEDLLDTALVARVEEREQEAHRDRLDALLAQPRDRGADAVLVERRVDHARRHDPLAHRQPQPPLDQRGLAPRQVLVDRERLRPAVAADVDQVAEAGGRDHAGARAVALEHDVGRDRRAVQQLRDVADVAPGERAQLAQAVHRRLRRVRRRARHLVDGDGGAVEQHQVGEGSADIDADPDHRVLAGSRRGLRRQGRAPRRRRAGTTRGGR